MTKPTIELTVPKKTTLNEPGEPNTWFRQGDSYIGTVSSCGKYIVRLSVEGDVYVTGRYPILPSLPLHPLQSLRIIAS